MADKNTIDASPTKEFFIDMLIRDIPLSRAIIDLVDNSVDGARRLRRNSRFDQLWVRIEITNKLFRIIDNCGGIEVDVAKEYAFRFGRDGKRSTSPRSVGQFGVGMKRTIFKLGTKFRVESKTKTSHFVVAVNVNEWKKLKGWEYEFQELETNVKIPDDQIGTSIEVSNLHEAVAMDFGLNNFISRLKHEIEEAHIESINNGLSITINTVPLKIEPLDILSSTELRPAVKELTYKVKGKGDVAVKIYAGVGSSDPSLAGWYVFCNGRMLVGADRSRLVGWDTTEEVTIPKYHNQFARFRGYVYFDSDDTSALPWNTTKTGVDAETPIYRAVFLEMQTLMRPVIDFLNQLDAEKNDPDKNDTPLEDSLEDAEMLPLDKLSSSNTAKTFKTPKPVQSKGPRFSIIQFRKPRELVERVRKHLKVTSNREIGEKTFDFYVSEEVED